MLGQPNTANTQSLPLGNGSLGVAEWAGGGFTARLNRSDTMPDRPSLAQTWVDNSQTGSSGQTFGSFDLIHD